MLFRVLGASLNLKKLLTTSAPSAIMVVWGITFDLTRIAEGPQFGFLTLSPNKLDAMRRWARAVPKPGSRRVRSRSHQSMVGKVQWWSSCSSALRSILPILHVISACADGEWLAPAGTAAE